MTSSPLATLSSGIVRGSAEDGIVRFLG
ncbi:MAG: hypothetical protein K0Q52_1347, partial [Microbacterium sp.]|nr:hypothetical protein [Microbacterium sp.]